MLGANAAPPTIGHIPTVTLQNASLKVSANSTLNQQSQLNGLFQLTTKSNWKGQQTTCFRQERIHWQELPSRWQSQQQLWGPWQVLMESPNQDKTDQSLCWYCKHHFDWNCLYWLLSYLWNHIQKMDDTTRWKADWKLPSEYVLENSLSNAAWT